MTVSPFAGKPTEASMLVDVPRLVTAYYAEAPDPSAPEQRVAFGASGHRGSAFQKAFNEWHILAITKAICMYRGQQKIDGPVFLGMDTHALSVPAHRPGWGKDLDHPYPRAGQRRVRQGRKTSTRSMRRASVERITCAASWRERRQSSTMLWLRRHSGQGLQAIQIS
jgi:hypothetical protein